MEIKLFTDGGIRDGHMALGFVAYDMNGDEIFNGSRLCGSHGTSNLSEYRAVIAGLEAALERDIKVIHLYSDSQLIVKQITGAFKVNKQVLKEHRDCVRGLLDNFEKHTIKWIPRTENKRADQLVGQVFHRRWGNCRKKTKKERKRSSRKH